VEIYVCLNIKVRSIRIEANRKCVLQLRAYRVTTVFLLNGDKQLGTKIKEFENDLETQLRAEYVDFDIILNA
jgi:hypothetical protein